MVAPGGPKLRESADPDAPEHVGPITGKRDKDGFLVLPPGHASGTRMDSNGVYVKFQNYTIAEFVSQTLRSFLPTPDDAPANHVADKTGLAGKYDFTLKFDSRDSRVRVSGTGAGEPSSPGVASEPSGLPDLFHALERQLGLKLVKANGFRLDTVVIDHIEKTPTAN